MLIKSEILKKIKTGQITLIFRRWKRPGVKVDGTQMTQMGVLGIDALDVVTEDQITERDTADAGFSSKDELIKHLNGRDEDIFRIRLHFAGEDPRKALREDADLSDAEILEIVEKLRQLDIRSQRGNWTRQYLQLIHDQPNTHAAILAKSVRLETAKFKPWIRKLKALGLTESLMPGYRLSHRGEKVLDSMRRKHEQ